MAGDSSVIIQLVFIVSFASVCRDAAFEQAVSHSIDFFPKSFIQLLEILFKIKIILKILGLNSPTIQTTGLHRSSKPTTMQLDLIAQHLLVYRLTNSTF